MPHKPAISTVPLFIATPNKYAVRIALLGERLSFGHGFTLPALSFCISMLASANSDGTLYPKAFVVTPESTLAGPPACVFGAAMHASLDHA
jgi:hypothetical protein